MPGPITIKLNDSVSLEDLIQRVQAGWDREKYGEPKIQDVNGKRFLGFPVTDWISVIAYPERKKVVVQAMPGHYNYVFTKEGKDQLRQVNREMVPAIAQGFRDILADIAK